MELKKILCAMLVVIVALGAAACGGQSAKKKAQPAKQNEIYVAADGNDESGTGSESAPYASISKAAKANPGSLILVHGGDYAPVELASNCSGSAASPTIIRVVDGERAVIHAADEKGIALHNVCNISIEGLETEGGTHGIEYMSTREAGEEPLKNISVRNCRVHGVRGVHGINVYACNDLAPVSDLTIEGCEVYDCQCGSSESVVLNGNVDGFLIAGNVIHDNNNIGIDMIGFEGLAMHPEGETDRNLYEFDQARNGICRDNVIYNISTQGNTAYLEDGEYDPCADGIYVDGGRDIDIYNNFIFNCDIGLEVATEHKPEDNELFRVSGIRVHDNVIADCKGYTALCFGGYDKDLGFTEECEFDHNTLVDNACQIAVQRSRKNRIHANLILGGETGVEFCEDCSAEDMVNDISTNVAAEIEDKGSWSEEYGKVYDDRAETVDGFSSLIKDTGSGFVPNQEILEIYEAQRKNYH